VVGVLAARVAELGHFETTGGGFLVLSRRVVPILAVRALKSDDFAHGDITFLSGQPPRLASSLSVLRLTRRDAGLEAPAALFPEVVLLG
jgi:hypothetical protein